MKTSVFVGNVSKSILICDSPLHQNPETGSVPLQNLNRSPPAVAERKHAARIGIEFEFQLDNCSKSVIAFS